MFKIALGAGHGLHTPGKRCLKALDPDETREWQLNDRICDYIESALKEYDGYSLLRLDDSDDGEENVLLSVRTSKANEWNADFYLSVTIKTDKCNIFRFYRRIVRDAQYRSADAQRTLEVWRGVRTNEDAHIFPYKASCDMVVDSTMAYDLHLLTPYLRELLPQVSEQSRYYLRALDILNRISKIELISTDALPQDSLYHEFIKF